MRYDNCNNHEVISLRLTASVAEKRINNTAMDSDNIIFGNHMFERMNERGISDIQVLDILRTGFIFEAPIRTNFDEWSCKIIKKLRGKRDAGVVVIFLNNNKLFLKTVEWEDLL